MADVFISYHMTTETSAFVRKIAGELESIGVSCWYAPRNIPFGDEFVPRILDAIDACKVVLLILDEGANASKYVYNETVEAFNRYKEENQPLIIPCKLGTFRVARKLNFYLHTFQDFALDGGARTEELIARISGFVGKAPPKIVKRGECGENVRFTLDENGLLTISGSGPMRDYNIISVDTPWRYERATITEAKIQRGVTIVGEGAFNGCAGLTSVTIPDSVTTIGVDAFAACARLTSVTIPNSVTTIASWAFSGCAGLTSVDIPHSVTTIASWAFNGCAGLTSVAIPDSVTEIGWGAFSGCAGLTSVAIPDSVTKIGKYAFHDCAGLMSVRVSGGASTIPYAAFGGCANLKDVTIPDGVRRICTNAFADCKALETVTLPDSLTAIDDGAFYGCGKLRRVRVPKNAKVADDAFPPGVYVERKK